MSHAPLSPSPSRRECYVFCIVGEKNARPRAPPPLLPYAPLTFSLLSSLSLSISACVCARARVPRRYLCLLARLGFIENIMIGAMFGILGVSLFLLGLQVVRLSVLQGLDLQVVGKIKCKVRWLMAVTITAFAIKMASFLISPISGYGFGGDLCNAMYPWFFYPVPEALPVSRVAPLTSASLGTRAPNPLHPNSGARRAPPGSSHSCSYVPRWNLAQPPSEDSSMPPNEGGRREARIRAERGCRRKRLPPALERRARGGCVQCEPLLLRLL